MARPPSHFRHIDSAINDSYGELRRRVKELGYVPEGNTSGQVIIYALGYILDIIADSLPREMIDSTFGDSCQSGATPLQNFVPVLVKMAVDEKRVTAQEIVAEIENLERFKKFAELKRDNRGNRSGGKNSSGAIRLSSTEKKTIETLRKVIEILGGQLGREPILKEVANSLSLPIEPIESLLNRAHLAVPTVSLGVSDFTPKPVIEAEEALPPAEIAWHRLREMIEILWDTFTDRERDVLGMRFGINGVQPRTLEEVGCELQVTRERIRQIEAKALRKMRHPTRMRKLERFLSNDHDDS